MKEIERRLSSEKAAAKAKQRQNQKKNKAKKRKREATQSKNSNKKPKMDSKRSTLVDESFEKVLEEWTQEQDEPQNTNNTTSN